VKTVEKGEEAIQALGFASSACAFTGISCGSKSTRQECRAQCWWMEMAGSLRRILRPSTLTSISRTPGIHDAPERQRGSRRRVG